MRIENIVRNEGILGRDISDLALGIKSFFPATIVYTMIQLSGVQRSD